MPNILVPRPEAQNALVEFATGILTEHKKFQDFYNKMEVIDQAYARYNLYKDDPTSTTEGQGIDAATTPVGVFNLPSTTPPIVVSQVDSVTGYLAETFLSGAPLFPMVSTPSNKDEAEMLEALIDDHATVGGYARQLLMFIRDGVKYNACALEADWTSIDQYALNGSIDLSSKQPKVARSSNFYTKLKRLDLYNTVWDRNVLPGSMASEGDYAGYLEILSGMKLRRYLHKLNMDGEGFNTREAFAAKITTQSAETLNYRVHPTVTDYNLARRPTTEFNWDAYLSGGNPGAMKVDNLTGNYEKLVLYARILPKDFRLYGPESGVPQIWKLVFINGKVLVHAKRILSAYDFLPILMGQPLEDGLGYQTQSIAESGIPFQTASSTLMNIRFNAARRAVSDRALYDSTIINPSDINAPVPAAKIPAKTNSLTKDRKLSDAYYQIPFDARGTETTIQDAFSVIGMSERLSGLNKPMQGEFQKGNKSVQEWRDTMGGADSRMRLPALTLEYQVFMPLKEILKLNIYQYGKDSLVISQRTNKEYNVKIDALRAKALSFQVADGFTPKSKLASTDVLGKILELIMQSPQLQVQYGPMLPNMVAHLASLMGVKGFKEYMPSQEDAKTNMIAQAQMDNGIDPRTGQPMMPQQQQLPAPNQQGVA